MHLHTLLDEMIGLCMDLRCLKCLASGVIFFPGGLSDEEVEKFRCHERTGRPLGIDSFIVGLENVLGRVLHKQKPGPKVSQKKNRNLQN